MASMIFLGKLFGSQLKVDMIHRDFLCDLTLKPPIQDGLQATIAKGNIIEGIEAKE